MARCNWRTAIAFKKCASASAKASCSQTFREGSPPAGILASFWASWSPFGSMEKVVRRYDGTDILHRKTEGSHVRNICSHRRLKQQAKADAEALIARFGDGAYWEAREHCGLARRGVTVAGTDRRAIEPRADDHSAKTGETGSTGHAVFGVNSLNAASPLKCARAYGISAEYVWRALTREIA